MAKQQSAPFHWYNWKEYVNHNNPDDIITREQYKQLSTKEKEQYKGIHNREIVNLFNLDQTTLPMVDKERYQKMLEKDGDNESRLHTRNEETKLHIAIQYLTQSRLNLPSGTNPTLTAKPYLALPHQTLPNQTLTQLPCLT